MKRRKDNKKNFNGVFTLSSLRNEFFLNSGRGGEKKKNINFISVKKTLFSRYLVPWTWSGI